MMGFQLPNILIFMVCAAIIWLLAYKDIQLSSILMLLLEGISVALILFLCWIVCSNIASPLTMPSSA
jgi:hypothetical protein